MSRLHRATHIGNYSAAADYLEAAQFNHCCPGVCYGSNLEYLLAYGR